MLSLGEGVMVMGRRRELGEPLSTVSYLKKWGWSMVNNQIVIGVGVREVVLRIKLGFKKEGVMNLISSRTWSGTIRYK